MFRNLTMILISIKFQQLLSNLRLFILLSAVLCRNKLIDVFFIFFFLLKNTFRILIFIYQTIFRLLSRHKLNSQKPIIFFVIIPYKIVVNWGHITVIKWGVCLFVSKLISEKLNFSLSNMGLSYTYWSQITFIKIFLPHATL